MRKLLRADQLNQIEPFFPCTSTCARNASSVQLQDMCGSKKSSVNTRIFVAADSWLEHARRDTDLMVERFGLNQDSFVVELASNDGISCGISVARIPAPGSNRLQRGESRDAAGCASRSRSSVEPQPAAREGKRADLLLATMSWLKSRISTTSSPDADPAEAGR